ncbi:hypothetical protein [Vibrio parahaemolyticus]|uniref:hypothetical protein n=1 Tax=Vibrio parahaemolyticus TaxID=670 RepID=UPI0004118F8E|nr:hypothetical protein [Vibrio parahaemolyticus]MDG2632723.1 hypothetical protein [Vibrio parahaemolyticus]
MKFRNDAYNDLVKDLMQEAFYIQRTNRGKIASIRQYAEVVIRKLLDLPASEKVTLGDKSVVKRLKEVSDDNQFLMLAVESIRLAGNKCTHTQETGSISDKEVEDCIDALFKMYASLLIMYFKKNKFGTNNEVMAAFSILPPIIRYLVLNEIYQNEYQNLSVIDKLSLVLLKAFDKDKAVSWVEARREELSQILPYTDEAIENLRKTQGDFVAQHVIDNAPDSMYTVCIERIREVELTLQKNGLLYNNFEQAKKLYLEKGILDGHQDEIVEFNSIMEFLYLGRNEDDNPNLDNLDSYVTLH